MAQLTEIRWHGRGGQGAKTAATLLAEAALHEDKYSQGFPEYGPERMGAPMCGYTRISDEEIRLHCAIYTPNIVVILDETLLDSVDVTAGLVEGGVILVNSLDGPDTIRKRVGFGGKIATIDATRISIDELGRPIPNTVMIGALLKATGILHLATVIKDIEKKFSKKFRERIVQGNIRAINRAFEEVVISESGDVSGGVKAFQAEKKKGWREIPEGGLILDAGNAVNYNTGSWKTYKPVWYDEKCTQCFLCWIMCPDDAMLTKDGKVIGIDYEHCKGCTICAAVCPPKANAIEMVLDEKTDGGE